MQPLTAGITRANTGVDGIVWTILGQKIGRAHV